MPDQPGSCQIKIGQLSDQSGTQFVKSRFPALPRAWLCPSFTCSLLRSSLVTGDRGGGDVTEAAGVADVAQVVEGSHMAEMRDIVDETDIP